MTRRNYTAIVCESLFARQNERNQMMGASLRDRASRAPHGAAARLHHTATIACAGCGKFISYADCLDGARFEYEPLSEFGPERSEWTCKRCVEEERKDA